MAAPANVPIGTKYGVPGSMWAAGHHTGVDYLTPTGTTLKAPAKSKIIHAGTGGWGRAYGIHVIGEVVLSGRTYRWITAHMSSTSVSAGQTVTLGQTLGKSGATGNVTGPHCHFEVRTGSFAYGSDVDPIILIRISASTDKMDPAAYFIGAHGDHVTWLGARLVAHGFDKHFTGSSYTPGPNFTIYDQANVADFQRAHGWSGAAADGFPGLESLRLLAADPVPSAPQPEVIRVRTADQNLAGNNATGIRTAGTRIPRYCAARKANPVDILCVQETTVASTVRPRLDSGLSGLMARAGGGKGRYVYAATVGVHVVAAGLITAASSTWYKGDDKQAAWVIYTKGGVLAMDVSFHLESESGAEADAKRVQQMNNIRAQAVSIGEKRKVLISNILFFGDTNSNKQVLDAMAAAGWRNVAKGTKWENTRTFMGWDGKSSQRFDYAFVHATAAAATIEALSADTSISDHAGLRAIRTLTH